MKAYVDTGLALAYIITNDPNHQIAKNVIDSFKNVRFILSDLSILEMTSVLSRTIDFIKIPFKLVEELKPHEKVISIIAFCIRKLNAEVCSLKIKKIRQTFPGMIIGLNDLMYDAMQLASELRLRTLDLLHITIAKRLNVDAFLTLDREILKKADIIERKLGMKVFPSQVP